MNSPNIRVERIQGRLRIIEATGRRIVRDEFRELLRIENHLKEMWQSKAEKDKKLILNIKEDIVSKIKHGIISETTQ